MTVIFLILIAIFCYALGNASGCLLLTRLVYKKHRNKYAVAETTLQSFYKDFGAPGAVALAAYDIARAAVAVAVGSLLMGIVGLSTVGKIFAAFCLLMGQCFPLIFFFKGGHGMLMACVCAFLVDWRVGLCCTVAYIVLVIFTRYAAIGSVIAAALAPIFLWIFDFSGLEGTLALLCTLVIVASYAENLVRLVGGTEPRLFEFPKRAAPSSDPDEDIYGEE